MTFFWCHVIIFVQLVVYLNLDEKTDLKQILFLNLTNIVSKSMVLTFQSLAHRCHPLRSHTAASARVVAFVYCIDIIIEQLLFIDLWSNLIFIDGVIQCL